MFAVDDNHDNINQQQQQQSTNSAQITPEMRISGGAGSPEDPIGTSSTTSEASSGRSSQENLDLLGQQDDRCSNNRLF